MSTKLLRRKWLFGFSSQTSPFVWFNTQVAHQAVNALRQQCAACMKTPLRSINGLGVLLKDKPPLPSQMSIGLVSISAPTYSRWDHGDIKITIFMPEAACPGFSIVHRPSIQTFKRYDGRERPCVCGPKQWKRSRLILRVPSAGSPPIYLWWRLYFPIAILQCTYATQQW